MDEVKSIFEAISQEINKFIIGREKEIKYLTIALLSESHILIEGVPGIAKTLLAKVFSQVLNLRFKRVQFTPDLLPSDIIGGYIFDMKIQDFVFREGPIFTNILLADEINRAPPKTQAALLEAMQERQATVGGITKSLDKPFFVIATQNPLELEGTYPLPEAQLDRFMFRIILDYPDSEQEEEIIRRYGKNLEIDPNLVITREEVLKLIKLVDEVHVSSDVERYVVKLIKQTRTDTRVMLGASTRAAVLLIKACKSLAAIYGRDYVIPDDVKELLFPVLNHRILPSLEYRKRAGTKKVLEAYSEIDSLIKDWITSTAPPR